MSPTSIFPKKFALIIGHRGAMGHGPENTRAAFVAGVRLGADAVECDVHLSKDGRLVVIHDDRLDRTTNGRGAVAGKTWAELRFLDAGSWFGKKFAGERLWRLEDLLGWAKHRRTHFKKPLQLIIEIKTKSRSSSRIADRVVAALRRAGMVRRAFVISFNHDEAARAKALCSGVRTGLLFSQTPRDLPRRMARTHADAVFPRFTLVTPEFMKEARRRGWYVGTWTVNEIPDMKRLAGLRVNAIASNFPERLVSVLCSSADLYNYSSFRHDCSRNLEKKQGLSPSHLWIPAKNVPGRRKVGCKISRDSPVGTGLSSTVPGTELWSPPGRKCSVKRRALSPSPSPARGPSQSDGHLGRPGL